MFKDKIIIVVIFVLILHGRVYGCVSDDDCIRETKCMRGTSDFGICTGVLVEVNLPQKKSKIFQGGSIYDTYRQKRNKDHDLPGLNKVIQIRDSQGGGVNILVDQATSDDLNPYKAEEGFFSYERFSNEQDARKQLNKYLLGIETFEGEKRPITSVPFPQLQTRLDYLVGGQYSDIYIDSEEGMFYIFKVWKDQPFTQSQTSNMLYSVRQFSDQNKALIKFEKYQKGTEIFDGEVISPHIIGKPLLKNHLKKMKIGEYYAIQEDDNGNILIFRRMQ